MKRYQRSGCFTGKEILKGFLVGFEVLNIDLNGTDYLFLSRPKKASGKQLNQIEKNTFLRGKMTEHGNEFLKEIEECFFSPVYGQAR